MEDGVALVASEHFREVQNAPGRFGLGKDVSKSPADRTIVLKQVLKNGWIRVRSHGGYTVFEFDGPRADGMWAIRTFCKRHGIIGLHSVKINDVRTGTSVVLKADDIIQAEDPEELLGFSVYASKEETGDDVLTEDD